MVSPRCVYIIREVMSVFYVAYLLILFCFYPHIFRLKRKIIFCTKKSIHFHTASSDEERLSGRNKPHLMGLTSRIYGRRGR